MAGRTYSVVHQMQDGTKDRIMNLLDSENTIVPHGMV